MSGDNTVSLDEVITNDRYNLARIYESQQDEVDPDVDSTIFANDDMHSYMHFNCRGLSSNWEKFGECSM